MNPAKITTTVGLNIGEINLEGVTLSFWDLGGQQELQSLWDKVDLKKKSINLYTETFYYIVIHSIMKKLMA